jgi:hypothetical protein
MTNDPELRSLLVVDVEDSSSRRNLSQVSLRENLYEVLDSALTRSQIVLPKGHREDRGDGALLVLPQRVASVIDVFDPLIDKIVEALRHHNAEIDAADWLRLRIGAHFGQVHRDENGWSSTDVTATFRITDADVVKNVFREAPRAHCVITVSEVLHQMVVQHGYRSVNPADYQRVEVSTRPADLVAWVRVPGYPHPPFTESARQPATRPCAAPSDEVTPRISIGPVSGGNVFNHKVEAHTIVAGNNIASGRRPDDE